jgi:hypothetical protein
LPLLPEELLPLPLLLQEPLQLLRALPVPLLRELQRVHPVRELPAVHQLQELRAEPVHPAERVPQAVQVLQSEPAFRVLSEQERD